MRTLLLLLLLCMEVLNQNNACYANCKQNSCKIDNALDCTDCDLGLINIKGMCLGTSSQPAPLTYLKPNSNNALSDPSIIPINCTISSQANPSKIMVFSATIGNTFTRSFSIPYQHVYLQIKFNAIVMAATTAPINPTLLLDVYSRTIFLFAAAISLNQSTSNSVSCNNSQLAQDVFYVDEKFNSSDTNIIIQARASGVIGSNIALTDIQIYYGNCSTQCEQCFGPTQRQCLTCKGLLTTLTLNNTCINCLSGFYFNKICLSCPVECTDCTYSNKSIQCNNCNTAISNITNSSTNSLGCQTSYFKQQTENNLLFSNSLWKSSSTVGSSVTQCGFYSLVGGISIGVSGSTLTKTYYNLPIHTTLYLSFTLFLIDQVYNDTSNYQISVDNNVQNPSFLIIAANGTQLTNECGDSNPEFVVRQFFNFSHNATSATITISIFKDYLGIRDVSILADNQTEVANCYSQINGSCTACNNGLSLLNNTCSSCSDGYYLVNSTCMVCSIFCKTCTSLTNCLSCQSPLVLQGDDCVDVTNSMFTAQFMPNINTTSQNTWTLYPNLPNFGIDSCNNATILGSSTIKFKFLSMNRTYTNLPAHNGIALFFDFYQIDDYPTNDGSVYFVLDSKVIPYTTSNLKTNICGNSSADAIVPTYLQDLTHTDSSLQFEVHFNSMGKIGINNVILFLLNNGGGSNAPFTIESVPTYSHDTPPIKGLTVKLKFGQTFTNTTALQNTFQFSIVNSRRLLTAGSSFTPILNSSTSQQNQILYLLGLQSDQTNSQLQVTASNPTYLYSQSSNNNQLVSQITVQSSIPRYIDISEQDLDYRTSLANLYNLFRGCAIIAMFIGMLSFVVNMSAAFDDFFLLCQLIFVHVFIQLDYNPPSIRLPFGGLHIVQFLQWVPWTIRQNIEQSVFPSNLSQYSPLVFQQYYEDIVFFRMIYQALLYFAVLVILWSLMHIILLLWDSKHPNTKYSNYLLHFYHDYDSKQLVMIDKIVRFAYFTVVWACVLQCTHLYNQPSSFNVWNSILTIVFFVAVFVYPMVIFIYLKRKSSIITESTFNRLYEDMRVQSGYLFYILFRYYKLVAIACFIGFLYAQNPVIPLILLMALNIADAVILIVFNPLGMFQVEHIQATIFYPYYPKVYRITIVIEQFLFILLQLLWLILYGVRSSASSSSYMAIGYVICAVVILLLLNGLLRLFWGFMKTAQHYYLQRDSFYYSVQRQIHKNQDPAQNHPIMEQLRKSQAGLSLNNISSRLNSKKMSHVSKLRR